MKEQNSHRLSHTRFPGVMAEGRRMIRSSTRKAGEVAGQVAREGRRIVGRTVRQTELITKRSPWVGLGAAACTGAFLGAIATWLFRRD